MSAKVNTRFVLILILAFGAALALLGGVYVLKLRGDATRSYRKGLEAFNRADYKAAYDQFGRALSKDPGNPEYLLRVSESLGKLIPQNAGDAQEYYNRYIGVLGHAALHNPTDAAAHLALIREVHDTCRRSNDGASWEVLLAAAETMHQQVPDGEALKPLARVYRTLAISRLSASKSDEDIQQSLKDLDQAASSLQAALDSEQHSAVSSQPSAGSDHGLKAESRTLSATLADAADLAWATGIAARMAWLNKMEISGQSRTSIDVESDALAAAAAAALQHSPDGPETARALLVYQMWKYVTAGRPSAAPANPPTVTLEDIRASADHLARIVGPDASGGLLAEVVASLQFVPEVGRLRAQEVLRRALAAHPTAYDAQFMLARSLYDQTALDEAEAASRVILDAQPLPVSYMARILFMLRLQAASLLGDIEYRRFEQLNNPANASSSAGATAADAAAQRQAQLDKLVKARDRLAALSVDANNDLLVTRADAKIAFARGDYVQASQKLEQLVRATSSQDAEMLSFAAAALQQLGQFGLAHERIAAAVLTNPNYIPWILAKAELELRIGQFEQATQTVAVIPESALTDPRTMQLVSAVRRAAASSQSGQPSGVAVSGSGQPPATNGQPANVGDPVQAAILAAQEAFRNNEMDNARAALLGVLAEHADSIPLLQAIAQVEIRAGNRDAAKPYIERGLKLQPADPLLNQLDAGLRYNDPVQATLEYLRATVPEPKARLTGTLVSMSNLAAQERQRAAQAAIATNGQAPAPATTQPVAPNASDIAARAEIEAAKAADELQGVDPDNAQLLDFRFSKALLAKDWAAAEALVATAKRLNIYNANGTLFTGRLEMARGNTREAIAAFEQATDRLSFSSTAWRALALAYQSDGNFAQAERAFEQAYRCNPNDIECVRAYVMLLDRRGDSTRALQILQSVHRLAPQDIQLREAWLDLEGTVGDKAVALRARTELYAENPADRENAASFAMLLATLEPTRETILTATGEPQYSVQRWASMAPSEQSDARLQVREKMSQMADQIVDRLAVDVGDDLKVAVLRATILREKGDLLAGEMALRDFIARKDAAHLVTEDMYVELGRYLARISHYTEATEAIRQAVALAGPKQRDAQVSLAMLLMQLARYEEATKAFEAALAIRDDQTTRLQLIECMINLGQLDEAEKRLAEVATGNTGSVSTLLAANIAKARGEALIKKPDLAGADKAFTQQRDLLAKAEQQDPTNPLPRILLAQSLIDEYNRTQRASVLDDALLALDRADRIRAGVPQVAAMRVAIQKERGDFKGAMAELQRSLQINPDNLTARRDLIQLQLESGDRVAALQAVDDAIRENPTLATWHELRGDILRDDHADMNLVIASYVAAYDRAATTSMLVKLTAAMLAATPPDFRGAAERIEARQDLLKAEPDVSEAYARALVGLGRRDQAIEQLRLAYALRSDRLQKGTMKSAEIEVWFGALGVVYPFEQNAEAERLVNQLNAGQPGVREIAGLAALWARAGDAGVSRALELQRQAVALCPPEDSDLRAVLHANLARLLLASGDLRAAADALEVVLRVHPTDWQSLNDLAYLKADMLNDAAGALPMAERLLGLLPAGAQAKGGVLDTVGWVYFKAGDLDKAKAHLGESLAIFPNVETYMHLAAVCLKSADAAGAEKQLVEAEKLAPNADQQQKIKALRDDIAKAGR